MAKCLNFSEIEGKVTQAKFSVDGKRKHGPS